ncbi:MAG: heme o synthase [Chloroflexota bacterium]
MLGYQKLSILTVAATYALIVIGGVVRVTGSGLGCPDWPTCHGQLLPPLEQAALIEFTHRLVGALVSPLILATTAGAWIWRRSDSAVRHTATALPLLLAVQILLGAVVVWLELPGMVVLVHLGFAMVILGGLTWVSVLSGPAPHVAISDAPSLTKFYRLARAGMVATFLLVLLGALVRAQGASWACTGFPTCNGSWLPFGSNRFIDIHLTHRLFAYLVTAHLIVIAIRALKLKGLDLSLRQLAVAVVLLAFVQIGIGAVAVSTGVGALSQALHLAGAAAVWMATVALTAQAYARVRGFPAASASLSSPETAKPRSIVAAYIGLTKPRVMSLLLLTTLAAMMIAQGGMPPLPLVLWTLIGGALASGGASAINCYFDRDIDLLMDRTTTRAIPSGQISPKRALTFGIVLGILSFAILTTFANLLAASLALGALLFYVVIYTLWLKRSSPNNIVIGGAAGAVPPLVGYAAVAGQLDLLAIYLFAIIFFWTPPHFWALALLMQTQYRRAGIPMLPLVFGETETRRQIVLYSILVVALTLIIFSVRLLGPVYLLGAATLGALLLYYAIKLWRDATTDSARQMFKFSMLYLALLFTVMVIDRQVIL